MPGSRRSYRRGATTSRRPRSIRARPGDTSSTWIESRPRRPALGVPVLSLAVIPYLICVPAPSVLLGVGLLGGFTTFSSFSVETVTLAQSGALARAATYVVVSVLLAVAAAALGLSLTRP